MTPIINIPIRAGNVVVFCNAHPPKWAANVRIAKVNNWPPGLAGIPMISHSVNQNKRPEKIKICMEIVN